MDWRTAVYENLKRRRKILFDKDSPLISELRFKLETGDRRAAVMWTLKLSEDAVSLLETHHPMEQRPRKCLDSARLWSQGRLKMPAAKADILACHAAAKELSDPAAAALCHAVAQGCSTVHTARHAIGLAMYELTALMLCRGCDAVEKRADEYSRTYDYIAAGISDFETEWAEFLQPENNMTNPPEI